MLALIVSHQSGMRSEMADGPTAPLRVTVSVTSSANGYSVSSFSPILGDTRSKVAGIYRLTMTSCPRVQNMDSPCLAWLSMPVPTQHQKSSNGVENSRWLPDIKGTM